MDKKYKISQMAKLLNVSLQTLRRWDREGILTAHRTPTNRRYYTHAQYISYYAQSSPVEEEHKGKTVIYARVSSRRQMEDLKNQVSFLRNFANAKGWVVDEVLEDVGSGLNYNRKKWNKLISSIVEKQITRIIVAHKDRFVRFGYEWFERFLKENGAELVVVNNEELSPEEELVQDLISIIHVFSCRIYGLRKYKQNIKDEFDVKSI